MINWERHFPTFAKWGQRLVRSQVIQSPFVQTPIESWRETERCCVVEVGRGVRRVRSWQIRGADYRQTASRERYASSRAQLSEGLEEDLRAVGARAQSCTVLLNPPWAVVKVFSVTPEEAGNPDRWILKHRTEVFPPGIEDDTMLAYHVFPASSDESSLAVGLIRRSTLVSLQESMARSCCWLNQVVIGPLAVLEASMPQIHGESAFLIDRSGLGSIGCWLVRHGQLKGWAELPTSDEDGLAALPPADQIQAVFGSWIQDEGGLPRTIEASRYMPATDTQCRSRWRFPIVGQNQRSLAAIPWTGDSTPVALERWTAWVFRWAVVMVAVAGLFSLAGYSLSTVFTALRGDAISESANLESRHDQLMAERDRLMFKLAGPANRGQSPSLAGLFWFNLGVAKPEAVWLRAIKLQTANSSHGEPLWQLEGLSLDRESPGQFAVILASRSQRPSRLTRLERVDPTKVRDAPATLRHDFYRFVIEVTR